MSTRLSMNTAFRPRPIDINRPLEIHRGILPTEADGCVRGVPSMPTGMEPEEEEEAHIQEAIAASLAYTTSADVEIPTPICKVVDGYDTAPNPRPYVPGNTYAFYRGEDIENTVEYDIDSEDEEFLSNLNQSKLMLSEDKLEYVIDKLEKETHVHHTSIHELNLARIETLFKGHDYGLKKELLPTLLEYWKMKKEAKSGLSLTLRFAKPPAFDDPSPYVAFRPREKDKDKFKKIRKNDSASLVKMRSLRQEMERSRTLLEMLKKREKLKKDQFTVFAQIFERLLVESSFKTEEDTKQPQQKKKKVAPTTSPPPFSSSLSPIASPVDHPPKPKPVPKSRPDYYYDISSVNTRIKFDPSLAAVPYVLQKPPPSSSSSISSSSSSIAPPPSSSSLSSSIANPRSLYPSFLQVLQRRPPRSFFLENEEEEEDEDEEEEEEETFEDRFLFEDDEKEREERDNTEEEILPRTPDVVASIAKLDEDAVFPRKVDGYIAMTRESTPFRGRARLGRGGRILFDRPLYFPSSSRLSSSSSISSSSSSATISSSSPSSSSSSIPPSSANSYINNNTNHNNNYSNTNQLNTSNSQHVTNTHEDESIDNNENNNSLDNNNKDNDTNDNMDDNDNNEDAHDESMVDSNINSEPEAKLYFNHRTSPSHSSLSSSKLFSPSQPILDSQTSPLPSSSPCTDKIDKIDKFDQLDNNNNTTKIDKMPTTVLHNYSKNQKRKLVDTSSIPSISM